MNDLFFTIIADEVAAKNNGRIIHDGNSGIAVVPLISTVFVAKTFNQLPKHAIFNEVNI